MLDTMYDAVRECLIRKAFSIEKLLSSNPDLRVYYNPSLAHLCISDVTNED